MYTFGCRGATTHAISYYLSVMYLCPNKHSIVKLVWSHTNTIGTETIETGLFHTHLIQIIEQHWLLVSRLEPNLSHLWQYNSPSLYTFLYFSVYIYLDLSISLYISLYPHQFIYTCISSHISPYIYLYLSTSCYIYISFYISKIYAKT